MTGTKIIMIDVEREYKELTENLDGDWLNVGSGAGGIINPLQIKDVPSSNLRAACNAVRKYLG